MGVFETIVFIGIIVMSYAAGVISMIGVKATRDYIETRKKHKENKENE